MAFYELIASVKNARGELAGYCFDELIPGARNEKFNTLLAFRRTG